ncbi:MAG: type II toxin-antitoxin system Phd/YefM family antitoxin [Gammaproteobacteria bacterium SHHR-1]|uniref:type II toxin-antitoxin system Phd/YefM family antitoxin n=1 Tax=Magnetovirga frankeli TaxID=947516 RepID=UPI0012931F91|nr:type II toxin-antitoxin system Phd/YefM family antitoxin [gamma proteobacterium SS-5]
MGITILNLNDFSHDLASLKEAASQGPVIVTDHGQPSYALLKIDDYYRLTGSEPFSLMQVMAAIPCGEVEFEPPRLDGKGFKPADFA